MTDGSIEFTLYTPPSSPNYGSVEIKGDDTIVKEVTGTKRKNIYDHWEQGGTSKIKKEVE